MKNPIAPELLVSVKALYERVHEFMPRFPQQYSAYWSSNTPLQIYSGEEKNDTWKQSFLRELEDLKSGLVVYGSPQNPDYICRIGAIDRPVRDGLSRVAIAGCDSGNWLMRIRWNTNGLRRNAVLCTVGGVVVQSVWESPYIDLSEVDIAHFKDALATLPILAIDQQVD